MEPALDPEDFVDCGDCGVGTDITHVRILDDVPLCPFCFEQYNPEL